MTKTTRKKTARKNRNRTRIADLRRLGTREATIVRGALQGLLQMIEIKSLVTMSYVCRGCGTYRKECDVRCGLCDACHAIVRAVVHGEALPK